MVAGANPFQAVDQIAYQNQYTQRVTTELNARREPTITPGSKINIDYDQGRALTPAQVCKRWTIAGIVASALLGVAAIALALLTRHPNIMFAAIPLFGITLALSIYLCTRGPDLDQQVVRDAEATEITTMPFAELMERYPNGATDIIGYKLLDKIDHFVGDAAGQTRRRNFYARFEQLAHTYQNLKRQRDTDLATVEGIYQRVIQPHVDRLQMTESNINLRESNASLLGAVVHSRGGRRRERDVLDTLADVNTVATHVGGAYERGRAQTEFEHNIAVWRDTFRTPIKRRINAAWEAALNQISGQYAVLKNLANRGQGVNEGEQVAAQHTPPQHVAAQRVPLQSVRPAPNDIPPRPDDLPPPPPYDPSGDMPPPSAPPAAVVNSTSEISTDSPVGAHPAKTIPIASAPASDA